MINDILYFIQPFFIKWSFASDETSVVCIFCILVISDVIPRFSTLLEKQQAFTEV